MATKEEQLKRDLRHDQGDFEATKSGDISRISGLSNLKQALEHRLITVAGTLVHRPEYGVGVKLFQGQITNIDQQRDLALRIRDNFIQDSRVESVNQVQFSVSDVEPDKFLIFVKYTPIGYNEVGETFDPFELGA